MRQLLHLVRGSLRRRKPGRRRGAAGVTSDERKGINVRPIRIEQPFLNNISSSSRLWIEAQPRVEGRTYINL